MSGLARDAVAAIRRLDVKWAKDRALVEGIDIAAAPSVSDGRVLEADEIALLALHQARVSCGTTSQVNKSIKWLKDRGHPVIFQSFNKG